MPTRDDFQWFKNTFHREIDAATAGTPIGLDLLSAIAAQETGHIWGKLRDTVPVDELLEICVGDTLDADKGRSTFPKTKADLVAAPRGNEMFAIAHEALVNMAAHVPSFAGVATRPNKFCHGYGIFQRDLQFFADDPGYFLERQWRDFAVCLDFCLDELRRGLRRAGLQNRDSLTDLEQVSVAIAYNTGSFKPAKGLKQGFFDGSRYYGELIFDFLRLSQTVPTPTSPATIPVPAPGTAPVRPPTPTTGDGRRLQVHVTDSALRLRSEPRIDRANPNRNVIARLPDGQIVSLVSGTLADAFVEVETSVNGAHFRGFAASQYLLPTPDTRDTPVLRPPTAPPTTGIVAVHAPRRPGSITRRTGVAGAQSLNERRQPGRAGTTPHALRDELAAIVDHLAVDRESHTRYQPRDGATFSNVYAHDYCHLAGVYLPRIWWTPDAIERLVNGEAVEPRLAGTIDEQRANDLFRWLRAFGSRFGWRQTGTATKLQTEVNAGAVGLIVARRTLEGRSGHITVVVPETGERRARRNGAGEVIAPLQSLAGSRNCRYGTPIWWRREAFADRAFWIHA